jgi:hypothetical protein
MTKTHHLIPQKFRFSNNDPILKFISSSSASAFENFEEIISDREPESQNIQNIKYFQYEDRIRGFSNLGSNWDSYNADIITNHAINKAIETLNYLERKGQLANESIISIFPIRDGGIQFEFDSKKACAELEISPIGDLNFVSFDDEGNIVTKEKLFEVSGLTTLLEESQHA